MAGDFTPFAVGQGNGQSGEKSIGGGGRFIVEVSGTFNGATGTVQLRRAATQDPDSPVAAGPWLSLGALADFTADAAQEIAVGPGMEIRLSVAGGGGSEALDAFYAIIDHRHNR